MVSYQLQERLLAIEGFVMKYLGGKVRTLALAIFVAFSLSAALAAERALDVGVTGSVDSLGNESPFVLLNNPELQALVFETENGPLEPARVDEALAASGLEATREDLIAAGILRMEDGRYALDFTLLTVADLRLLDEVGRRYGASLAEALIAHWPEIEAAIERYDQPGVSNEALAYVAVGCFALDWDGLSLTVDLGYRISGRTHANGDTYTLWAKERSPEISLEGYYWGSHNSAYGEVTLSTFGDHAQPRLAFPDILWRGVAGAIGDEGPREIRHGFYQAIEPMFELLGARTAAVLMGLRNGIPLATTAESLGLNGDELERLLALLEAEGYIARNGETAELLSVVLSENRDGAWLSDVRTIVRQITAEWLGANAAAIAVDLEALTPMRSGVTYESVFTEAWHYIFGAANRDLAARGLMIDPYGDDRIHVGYEPFAWETQLDSD